MNILFHGKYYGVSQAGEANELKYRAALLDGAMQMGIELTEELIEKLGVHYGLMHRWSSRMNLTSVTDPEDAARLHGLDCLLFSEFFEPESAESVADIGSGAGFPGIILALARPNLKMCLVEPLRKRTSFLKVALAALSRSDVLVRQSKLVASEQPEWVCETIVSRATIAPLKLLELTPTYLKPGGRLITTSGDGAIPLLQLENRAKELGFESARRKQWELPGGETRILDEFTLAC